MILEVSLSKFSNLVRNILNNRASLSFALCSLARYLIVIISSTGWTIRIYFQLSIGKTVKRKFENTKIKERITALLLYVDYS